MFPVPSERTKAISKADQLIFLLIVSIFSVRRALQDSGAEARRSRCGIGASSGLSF
jgi:hypothetical protein